MLPLQSHPSRGHSLLSIIKMMVSCFYSALFLIGSSVSVFSSPLRTDAYNQYKEQESIHNKHITIRGELSMLFDLQIEVYEHGPDELRFRFRFQ